MNASTTSVPPQPRVQFQYADAELVFGLVAAVGTDLDDFQPRLEANLRQFKYTPVAVRLSSFLKRLDSDLLGSWEVHLKDAPEYERLMSHMTGGTKLREETAYGGILALHAAAEIRAARPSAPSDEFLPRRAHVLRSLKHPEEVRALRRIYGPGFFLIALYAPPEERLRTLCRSMSEDEAKRVMERDEDEPPKPGQPNLGQQTRETFALADVFIRASNADEQLGRFMDMVFGKPCANPTREEHAMFLAYAASVRSASLSRQVGAAIMTPQGEIVATGANDTPAPGGGEYWPGKEDRRDHVLGVDTNDEQKARIVVKIMRALRPEDGRSDDELRVDGKKLLRGTGVLEITEFGRDLHAEMDALLACGRVGISPRGCTLFCTTFPCHNCAKHIVAAGIQRVVYIEPYPKSRAMDLHSDAVSMDPACLGEKVLFEPFVGVGPRKYFDLFSSMGISTGFEIERKKDGKPIPWTRGDGKPRVPMIPSSYLERERSAAEDVSEIIEWIEKRTKP